MVTQRPYLFPGTVEHNLQFGPRQRGELLTLEAVEDLLVQVGLAGYAQRDVANLSGGEAQRVSFARTLANSPFMLLLDEPTSALDDAAKAGIEKLILQIVDQRKLTCILVTHDIAQAALRHEIAHAHRSGLGFENRIEDQGVRPVALLALA